MGLWKYLWKHDPATLAQGIDILMYDLVASPSISKKKEPYLELRRRAGLSLISLCKHFLERLVHVLLELCERASTLMAMEDSCPHNSQIQPRPVL